MPLLINIRFCILEVELSDIRRAQISVGCRNLPPSQGGKFVGFGSDPVPVKRDDDYWTSLSSVSGTAAGCRDPVLCVLLAGNAPV